MKTVDYLVIEAPTAPELMKLVKNVLAEGWEPCGAPGQPCWPNPFDLSGNSPYESWWQGMIKREK